MFKECSICSLENLEGLQTTDPITDLREQLFCQTRKLYHLLERYIEDKI
jgi:hypothetical protein